MVKVLTLLDLEHYLEKRSQELLLQLAQVSPSELLLLQGHYRAFQELLTLVRKALDESEHLTQALS